MKNFAIKEGYKSRLNNDYYEDETGTTTWQPDVYEAVVMLARRSGIKTIIDIGSGNGLKVKAYRKEFKFIFVDFGSNLKVIEKNIGKKGNQFIDQDFEKGFPTFSDDVLANSIVVCSDVIEHMRNPDILAKNLVTFSKKAPFVLISTPDRVRTRGVSHYGPPQNQTHVREWSMEELDTYLRSFGMDHQLTGITRTNDLEQVRRTIFIMAGTYLSDIASAPKKRINVNGAYLNDAKKYAADYYWSQSMQLTDEPTDLGFKLGADEWLSSPRPEVTVGAVLSDAIKKEYDVVKAQIITVQPDKHFSWPDAGILRQGHGMIGRLGGVRSLWLRKSDNKTERVYPLQLILFCGHKPGAFRKNKRVSLGDRKLIDTGHIVDDYLLDATIGWNIAQENAADN